ncbi:MFS transporter [Fulvivirga sedimenti]|uniref:MFS transporter n=1 Tax=Fulvivirga sedimenti TaxID=2879465 RepID=A0A9X1HV25_9BACT|nr:MFS transporter [Fulvivirga sedimenti]MCA6075525.1 MFS transporter [Fulvivirga sedimenti]MCA6076702.1 MFS transporter [Fulvivirga sedimenti]MCA6077830.1 MFS transporter [Fulvivirga sedimenti]
MYTYSQQTGVKSSQPVITLDNTSIKWPEVLSLGALNAAIAISWIAYLEYQPVLLQRFGLTGLSTLLVFVKALVLILVPVVAGWIADRNLARRSKYFMTYMIGISATAMIFMIVASIISLGPEHGIAAILPVMVVLWLIGMAVFIAPAYSMLVSFANKKNLPIAMGVVILITDLIYSLEPLVISLIQFFGETLTFVVGGILVLGTGYLFYRLTTDEVYERVQQSANPGSVKTSVSTILKIGLMLGVGRAFLVEYIPVNSPLKIFNGDQFSFMALGLAALIAFVSSRYVIRTGIRSVLQYTIGMMIIGILIILMAGNNSVLFVAGSLLLATGFGLANVSGLPYVFGRIAPRHITIGIGAFLGASAIAEGIFEIWYAL